MAAVEVRRRPATESAAQASPWSAPARAEVLLAAVRAALAGTELVVALALGAGDTTISRLLLVPLAVSLVSLAAVRVSGGRTPLVRRIGALAMAADLVFLVASAALVQPGALAAGWLTRLFVLLEGPVRYGLLGAVVTAVPAVAVAVAWASGAAGSGAADAGAAAAGADGAIGIVPALLAGVVVHLLRRSAGGTSIALPPFEQAFAHSPVGLAVLDMEGRVLQANPSLAELVGTEVEGIQQESFAALLEPTMNGCFTDAMARLQAGEDSGWYGELALRRRDGAVTWSLVGLSVIRGSAEDRPAQVIAQVADLSDQRAAQQALQHEATHDRLTGLPGRQLFVQRLSDALEARGTGEDGQGVTAVLFCDLDGFKTVNDRYGHARGDQLLAITARRLAGALRLPTLAARWGGDEFVVLCDGVASLDEVRAIASRLISSVSQPIADEDLSARISMSVGIAVPRSGERDPYRLIDAADAAMYRAKRLGTGGWVVSDTGESLHVPVH